MRLIKRIATILAALVVVFLAAGFFLPSAWQVERSIDVPAGSEHVLPLVDAPKRWIEWAAWTPERYPDMQIEHGAVERGPGAVWSWKGESSGNGRMEILSSDARRGVDFELVFEGFEPARGSFRFEPIETGTRVTWTIAGDAGLNPISRYFCLLMDSMMGPDLDAGLEGLARLAVSEKEAAEQAAAEKAAAEARARAEAEAAAAAEADAIAAE